MAKIPEDAPARVEEALPEIMLVGNPVYRAAIVQVWVDFWEKSGFAALGEARFSAKSPSVPLIEHIRGVTRGAIGLADAAETTGRIHVDRDVLLTSCLLHDVSRLVEVDADANPTEVGMMYPHAYLAGEAARLVGLPVKIVNLIITHTPIVNKESPFVVEATLLRHADSASAEILAFLKPAD